MQEISLQNLRNLVCASKKRLKEDNLRDLIFSVKIVEIPERIIEISEFCESQNFQQIGHR